MSKLFGRYLYKMRSGKVLLPKVFLPHLVGREIHIIVAVKTGKRYLLLIPEDNDINKKGVEKGIIKAELLEPWIKYYYHGTCRLTKAGAITIPKKAREIAGFSEGDVIIAGLVNSIEIWNKNDWEAELEKLRRVYPMLDETLKSIVSKHD